ncbi:MAG: hypothetical protein ACK4SY_05710 [Pyrobaculum sp.]
MFGLLFVIINATAMAVPIATIPFQYTTQLGGCANFSTYLDPLSPWGLASIYVVTGDGRLSAPTLEPYPTPKYARGRACGDFLSVRVDRWRAVGPLVSISIGGEDAFYVSSVYLLNRTAVVRVKSLTPPVASGDFVYRVSSLSVGGIYVEEYVAYGPAQLTAYGVINVTYISLGEERPDFYIYIPTPGVRAEGLKPWAPDVPLWFSPNQTAGVGRPRVVVEQISIPVGGECGGVAVVINPLERPLSIYVRLEDGSSHILSLYQLPAGIATWRLRGAVAKTLDGRELPVEEITAGDGAPVGICLVEGMRYYVKTYGYRYPAEVRQGRLEAETDLVAPEVAAPGGLNAVVVPQVARGGSAVTVRLYYNGTPVGEVVAKASPLIVINASQLYREVRVVDLLGEPVPHFAVYVGGLKFIGRDGVAEVIPTGDTIAVEINGVRYVTRLAPEVKIPILTWGSFLKVAMAAAVVGVAAALGVRRREKEIYGEETVEV